MDQVDQNILWILDGDSRCGVTEIADQLGVSKQLIRYRLDKLLEDRALRGCIATIDINRVGLLPYRVYAQLKNSERDHEAIVIDSLIKHNHTLWVVSTAGNWDLEAVFVARNFVHFNSLLKDWKSAVGKFLSKINISMTPVSYRFRRDYLVNRRRSAFKPTYYGFEPRVAQLDDLDVSLLGEVAQNCRRSNEEIGRRVNVTYHTVDSRLATLHEEKVLQGYSILIDLAQVSRKYLKVLLFLEHFDEKTEHQFLHFCMRHNYVIYLTEVLGDWQWEVETEVEGYDRVHEFLKELRREFPKHIVDFQILEVVREHKHNYFPHVQPTASRKRRT